ncbi:MAG: tRNA (guanosine(37)-N1)-methyltransferase TrmD [bacterium]
MIQFDILTIFPKIFDSYLNESILKRAQKKKLIKIKIHDIRKQTTDKRQTVDGKPYGGGPGMILKIEPIYKTLKKVKRKNKNKTILLSPTGKKFDQKIAQRYAKLNQLILICGRYEGIDARVDKLVDEKISIGDYVLTGGELPAMAIIDAVSRLKPKALGNPESLTEETFNSNQIEYPQYTRPENFKGWQTPKILLSGNHQKIRNWRQKPGQKQSTGPS